MNTVDKNHPMHEWIEQLVRRFPCEKEINRVLSRKLRRAKPFYGIIVVASLVGMLINFLGINPIDALFWTAVLNGLLAPPLLVLIMLVANSKQVMGKHTNGRWINLLGWVATGAMFAAAEPIRL